MVKRRLVIGRGAEPPSKQLGGVAQLDPFSFEQVEAVHQGRMTAWLVSGTLRAPKPDSVRPLKRIVRVLDGDGNDSGETMVEITASMLTLKAVSSPLWVEELKDTHAFACGLKTAQELSQAWLTRHPRTRRVRFVQFACGDVRDRDWFMDRTGGYTLSPAQSIQPDAPVPIMDAHRWTGDNRAVVLMSPAQRERHQRSLSIRFKKAQGDEIKAVVQDIVEWADTLKDAA